MPRQPHPEDVADAVVHAMLATDRASAAAGIELVEVRPGEVTVTMTVTPHQLNGHGVCHGGVVFTLADTAFALACNSHGPRAVAAGADVAFARPARVGDLLRARGVERERFGRSGLYDVTVTRGEGSATEVVAEFRGRSRVIGPDQPGSDGVRVDGREESR